MIHHAIDTIKPSPSSLASTIGTMLTQVPHNPNYRQSGRGVFDDLLGRLHDPFIPATRQGPFHCLTPFAVSAGCFFGDSLHDAMEVVAGVMSSPHLMPPEDRMVQYTVRTLIDQHYPPLFAVPFTDLNTIWSHLDGYRTYKTAAVAAPASRGPTATRPPQQTPPQHRRAPQSPFPPPRPPIASGCLPSAR